MKKLILTLLMLVFCISTVFSQNVEKINWMLELQKKIELSEKQVKGLQTLKMDLKKYFINQKAQINIAELDLKELMRDKANNLKAIKSQLGTMSALRDDMRFSQIETEVKAFKLLTTAQNGKFGSFMEKIASRNTRNVRREVRRNAEVRDREQLHERLIELTDIELKERQWEEEFKAKTVELSRLKEKMQKLKNSNNEAAYKETAIQAEQKAKELQLFRKELEAYQKKKHNEIKK